MLACTFHGLGRREDLRKQCSRVIVHRWHHCDATAAEALQKEVKCDLPMVDPGVVLTVRIVRVGGVDTNAGC
jgi:hypothetical protein